MSGRSPRPDFGRTDYRFKINDNFGMLHETTLILPNKHLHPAARSAILKIEKGKSETHGLPSKNDFSCFFHSRHYCE